MGCCKIKVIMFFSAIFFVTSSFAQDIGSVAPDFSFQTLDHGRISLSDFRGKVVYLFFLGHDCPPCIAQGPITESQINKIYGNKNFQAVGIDVWDGTINQMLTCKQQTGRQVITLVENFLNFGSHELIWDGKDRLGKPVASGNYFYVLQGNNFKETKKMTLIY